ncbi:hypothetical protein TPHA_0K01680 [Tetrapisispora phaffii CBS 4417]|uniref:Phospholipid/glycerol acyltransferase domain-containing protein n=1 Tax=Tetrapisispora phaffii (strain ATCC 24235 / CBS 4417 / NBRC 1672 / NRRL Y-8282 / UCD 70-5) TaxID=1071381 RepID=G8BZH3_TETPH|nr:hypothetical protein TPHA_0K01680 [Tetrapisispora phaffii CBS 4417]CCE65301.1 hypothetical protein TPHA_0K01680 [Tetrapisispora phaffii CBS 4417]
MGTEGNSNLKASTDVADGKKDDQDIYKDPPIYRFWMYDFMLWLLSRIFDCFFREIRSRGAYKVPKKGPVIFVAAPHANQFVDPIILAGQVNKAVNKRVSFLIAAKSLKRVIVGFMARCVMSIGVERAQDNLKLAKGKITVDPENSLKIIGHGTSFLKDMKARGLIGLPKSLGNTDILSIESDTVLYVRKEFKMNKPEIKQILTKGTSFKYAAKVDQSRIYQHVFEHLYRNGCIGIFPEGGSHDRTDLLPLKAGVALMALGCIEKHPDCNVKIVPCGMNYFSPHRFRSRAVVEFGDPIEIPKSLVEKYHNPETNREAVRDLLDTITEGLKAVTVTCPDFETLMVVQAMRRLYTAQLSTKLSLPMIIDMNRKIVKYYQTYKDDPEFMKLRSDIKLYNAHLSHFNLPDHLVEDAKFDLMRNIFLFITKLSSVVVTFLLALPGIIMFSPVFYLAKRISEKKAKEALANSTVKVQAKDVVATWKILIGMGITPLLYIFWSFLMTYYLKGKLFDRFITFGISYIICATITYSALIVGDYGMDTFKSLMPLYYSVITPTSFRLLQNERLKLSERITEIMNTLGAELFMKLDDEENGKAHKSDVDEEVEDMKTSELKRRRLLRKKKSKQNKSQEVESTSVGSTDIEFQHESDAISLINSDNSLSNIPLFSTDHRQRSSSTISSFPSPLYSSSVPSEVEMEELDLKDGGISSKIAKAVWDKRHDKDE